jgi:hypothetical protein
MAGLYLTIGNASHQRLKAVADRMRFRDESQREFSGAISYAWLAHDNPDQFAPAIDSKTGVHVVISGRLCLPPNAWQAAERLPYEGGLACRHLLDRYLSHGAAGIAPYNGAAVVVIHDPRDQTVHMWTDQFGYHPAFVYGKETDYPTVFTTFPETIRQDSEVDATEDDASMAEFLRAWRTTPPHTYFRHLKHAGAAVHRTWSLNAGTSTCDVYWTPFESGFFRSVDEAADALSDALRQAVGERTAAAKKSALFVSGGADSRVMLFGAHNPTKVVGVNLYERPTAESAISRDLCERVGTEYVGVGRDGDYYPRMLEDNVRWSGGMWSSEDNHYLGVRHVIDELDVDLVMTACTTDWVFKGYGLEKQHRRFLGRNLPLLQFAKERVDGFLPNYPRAAPAAWKDEIDARMAAWFDGCPQTLTSDRDRLVAEDRRIRPACYTVSVSGQIMYRTYPYDTFLADSRVAECYSRIPARWKLNGEVWGEAASRVCAKAGDIVDANHGWALNAGTTQKLLAFAMGWMGRRVKKPVAQPKEQQLNGHPPSYASWPDYGWYANHSETFGNFWNSVPTEDRERMAALWGSDPWSESLDEWAGRDTEIFRLVTLLANWRIQNDVPTVS